jgi:hypothetical protein
MAILMAARHGALDEPVTAEIITIFDDLVPLLRMLFFRRSARFVVVISELEGGGKCIPDEPSAAGSVRAVLPPCAEMVAAGDALPARPPDGKVCLSGEVFFRRAAISVA